jgi:hypothetical protein
MATVRRTLVPYIDPEEVLSPKNKLRSLRLIYDTGRCEGSWSVALLNWDSEERVGLRWNGDSEDKIGNPQSHGNPTWFVLPDELTQVVRQFAEELGHRAEKGLLSGYSEMSQDTKRETDATEWCEGMIESAPDSDIWDEGPLVEALNKAKTRAS